MNSIQQITDEALAECRRILSEPPPPAESTGDFSKHLTDDEREWFRISECLEGDYE